MSISNLTPTSRAKARIFIVIVNVLSAAAFISQKIIAIFYAGSRTPTPSQEIENLIKACFIKRFNELPGSPAYTTFEEIISRSGLPRFCDFIYGLIPDGYLHRISGEITIKYVTNETSWFVNYVTTGTIISDIDKIRFWLNTERKSRDMIDSFSNISFKGTIFNIVFGNRVSIDVIEPINKSDVSSSTNYNLHTFTKDLKPSYGLLFTTLFMPQVQSDITDYDLLYNIKYDTNGISPSQWSSVVDDLLNWFFIGGNANPKGKFSSNGILVPPSKEQSPNSSTPKIESTSKSINGLEGLTSVPRFNLLKSLVIDVLNKIESSDDLNDLIKLFKLINQRSFKDNKVLKPSFS